MVKLLFLILVFCSSGASVGLSITLYDQPYNGTAGGIVSQTPDLTAYDNFTLGTNSAITDLSWTGSHNSGTVNGFTIGFWTSVGSQPGSLLQSYVIPNNASETFLGTFGGFPQYTYSANLVPSFNAAAGTEYWLSIQADISGGDWGWAGGSGGDGISYQDEAPSSRIRVHSDLAFTLNGTTTNGTGVPDSGNTALLLAGAVVALALFRCRHHQPAADVG